MPGNETKVFVISRPRYPVAAFAVLLSGTACGDAGPVTVDVARSNKLRLASPLVAQEDRQALTDGQTDFSWALYQQVKATADNVVVSPFSVSTALAMTYAGARGQTESEIAQALRFLPQLSMHPAMNELTATLAGRGRGSKGADGGPFRLRLVNSVWAQKGDVLVPAFLDTLAEQYGAGVNLVDFATAAEDARTRINAWVQQETENKIKELIPKGVVNSMTALVLTNAIYFNAAWQTPFPATTRDEAFTRLDGGTVTVPTMHGDGNLRATVGQGYQAVALPYQEANLSMLFIVPDQGRFAEIESAMDGRHLKDIVAALTEQPVVLAVPRFKFETPIPLNDALKALGMQRAFEPGLADFSGIDGTMSLFIQAVIHKAFIAINEKGTEAAAATAVVVGRTAFPVGLRITIDRPFLFVIRDEPTGAILFLGRVVDPSRISGG